ncbi:MAG TPA: hypothetical protein VFF18_07160 [Woeseiaceae bacterium]|nr:hypothetical protein [Woeseiaceae bacterium]
MSTAWQMEPTDCLEAEGEFVDFDNERHYAIRNVDRMPPFFITVVSNVDHWLFASSTGGVTAGRVSPDTALFPYVTVDKIHESTLHTGPRTFLRVEADGRLHQWEPFNREQDEKFAVSRNLYKNVLGNRLCFEEINHDLELAFRYTWETSDTHGFVRRCELTNRGRHERAVELLDGLQNILPAGTPRFAQTNSSNLVDAYKWTELEPETGLGLFTLYSGITDRAEPCESLKANVAFCLGLDDATILVSSEQVETFRHGGAVRPEDHRRGIRGAFLVNQSLELPAGAARTWQIVADVEKSQAEVVELSRQLEHGPGLAASIDASVRRGSDELARIMSSCDAFQATAEETVTEYHYANVLFNVLRGGYFPHQYDVVGRDFRETVRSFNSRVHERNAALLDGLPDKLPFRELLDAVRERDDRQLERLCHEYLPITFGRRHGDPSRPWNHFSIRLRDRHGYPVLWYEGNWRDIFQNWEALAVSYPEFVENMIAKFVNASTMDGYNPYRITKGGIDWEVEDPDDPWSYIGYWGDHQIVYLLKLLEISSRFHPARLARLLHEPVFAYANVPYRIRPFEALLQDPKNTIDYDERLAAEIERLEAEIGADARLVLDGDGEVRLVTLLEKLLVPLLAKLGNLVVDGGIWMNTQRPEWNDANNALVGQGLSMVTLYYLRRYVRFLQEFLGDEDGACELSREVSTWLDETAAALGRLRAAIHEGDSGAGRRLEALTELGQAASRYRQAVYGKDGMSGSETRPMSQVEQLLADVLAVADQSIGNNRREDGLYHAYNLLEQDTDGVRIETLYPMLEGQVAALSSGAIGPDEACDILESLFASDVYRADQDSFMLYPDRRLPGFLEKNRIPEQEIERIPLLGRLLAEGNRRIVLKDADGCYRFSAEFANEGDLLAELDDLARTRGSEVEEAREPLRELFERTFGHQFFTGRSGTMFGFEGLGCIYWHMVSKLLLAVQENFFSALDGEADEAALLRLGNEYYRVRAGLGFNKTPAAYGAFPADPYSHTPRYGGARQPGMTGQVKEGILARFGELGVRVADGCARFEPRLLRRREFADSPPPLRCLGVDGTWSSVPIPDAGLAFTWCQVPVVYRLADEPASSLTVTYRDGTEQSCETNGLSAEDSASLFRRDGRIRQLTVTVNPNTLLAL